MPALLKQSRSWLLFSPGRGSSVCLWCPQPLPDRFLTGFSFYSTQSNEVKAHRSAGDSGTRVGVEKAALFSEQRRDL